MDSGDNGDRLGSADCVYCVYCVLCEGCGGCVYSVGSVGENIMESTGTSEVTCVVVVFTDSYLRITSFFWEEGTGADMEGVAARVASGGESGVRESEAKNN